MRAFWSGWRASRKRSIQYRPLATMKMLRMKIVSAANTELTNPTPMSCRVPAASGILSGSFAASSSIFPVMS